MMVEALRTEHGILIPFTEELSYITDKKILLEIKVIPQNRWKKKPFPSASDLFGILKHRKPSKPVSIEDMELAVQQRRKHDCS